MLGVYHVMLLQVLHLPQHLTKRLESSIHLQSLEEEDTEDPGLRFGSEIRVFLSNVETKELLTIREDDDGRFPSSCASHVPDDTAQWFKLQKTPYSVHTTGKYVNKVVLIKTDWYNSRLLDKAGLTFQGPVYDNTRCKDSDRHWEVFPVQVEEGQEYVSVAFKPKGVKGKFLACTSSGRTILVDGVEETLNGKTNLVPPPNAMWVVLKAGVALTRTEAWLSTFGLAAAGYAAGAAALGTAAVKTAAGGTAVKTAAVGGAAAAGGAAGGVAGAAIAWCSEHIIPTLRQNLLSRGVGHLLDSDRREFDQKFEVFLADWVSWYC